MDPLSPSERSSRNSPNLSGGSTLSHRPSPDVGSSNRKEKRPESNSPSLENPIPDDEHGADLPMNMSASVMLTSLPRDAHQALADVEAIDAGKGMSELSPASISSPLRHSAFSLFPFFPCNMISQEALFHFIDIHC